MTRIKTDLCIIGAGSGGLSLAAGAAQMGARVVLVEGHRMGGDCLNYGCVPSKALLAAARQAHAVRTGGCGVAPGTPQVAYAVVMEHVARIIAAIAPHDSVERFEGLGVRVIRAWGRFAGPRMLEAGGNTIRARRFVIATGSGPVVPPIPGLENVPYLTNETLFDLRERPEHLLVIGAGPIGLEMAQAHARLGSRVTVIEGARALSREDPEAVAPVLDRLRTEGVDLREKTPVTAVSGQAGAITVETGAGPVTGTHLLLAVGRKPVLERLNLPAAGVETTPAGVKVGDDLRSTNRRIYAIGDAAGRAQFTHAAGYHAAVVIRPILFGLPARARATQVPRAVYTDPEMAQVGLTEAEARRLHGARLRIARADYAGNDRAVTAGRTAGFVKVMVVAGRPVGATLVGEGAGDLAAVWSLVLANRLKISAVTNMIAPYPTLAELNKRAAGAYFIPGLFENVWVKRAVRIVQGTLP
ncbi:pyruvate/2-oxoglutarate dehydrogenase complex dihydrolipoamide dehydrogenase (E3) component [Rhodovulum imhoffii]|uniref:Pyruvate/2-oxoglutarate dehydrogenase complex dihydrolipoamide dehydrogenase (E3) component n=1 Tax=Rhodovulum imhoffii TaxID=365340 RepID=A0A2T5BNG5_9RHOB|nr:FAD-dependent oxidoreductase [Rhodovulum imhoffii]MBK5932490.1 dihydrolipoamide dehydrogenase [Rhodovulum imhoffii]PTN00526.1 pyruvate/2-oxoglutarate dehydrogenase complex dihydrolipoamide dehydrogenase (E3) component [Rhodovulum imhoffii]